MKINKKLFNISILTLLFTSFIQNVAGTELNTKNIRNNLIKVKNTISKLTFLIDHTIIIASRKNQNLLKTINMRLKELKFENYREIKN